MKLRYRILGIILYLILIVIPVYIWNMQACNCGSVCSCQPIVANLVAGIGFIIFFGNLLIEKQEELIKASLRRKG